MTKELLEAALERFCGGTVVVREWPDSLGFEITVPGGTGVGGYYGGTTSGVIKKGELFPRMSSGRDPLGVSEWYKIMYPA
jgi:hypothetical protein